MITFSQSYSFIEKRVTIVVGKKIAPFLELANQLQKEIKESEVRIIEYENINEKDIKDFTIPIGLEALKRVLPFKNSTRIIYTMVLNPINEDGNIYGVAMIPSPRRQLLLLKEGLGINSLTIFFTKEKTLKLKEDFEKVQQSELNLNFIEISSEKEFLNVLETSYPKSGAILLLPDSILLTEQGIKKLVLKSYENRIPIVGFSPMYLELGVPISFWVSEKITAKAVASLIKNESSILIEKSDHFCYPNICEIRFSKKLKEKFNLKLNFTQFIEEGIEVYGID